MRRKEKEKIILKEKREDEEKGILEIKRIGEMMESVKGNIMKKKIEKIQKMEMKVMIEIGRERVEGEGDEMMIEEEEEDIVREEMK